MSLLQAKKIVNQYRPWVVVQFELRDKMAEMYGKSPVQLRLYLPTISPQ